MPVASTVKTWLEQRHVAYETVSHESTVSSARTAAAAHVPGRRLAKGVVLKRADDSFLVMVIPADNMVHLGRLHRALDETLCLASENELTDLFPDCAAGAVPALGQAYGLPVLVDTSLFEQPEVFIESGDHRTLLRLSDTQFTALQGSARRLNARKYS
ncbi:MAG: YbaK/EbsC family protein [Halioglobus sp.]|nr:YbaK/EbsC family protein [Halioglobus sp.]MCB1729409.1 YbaK/EbsC family protein [Halieaceae bacterium]